MGDYLGLGGAVNCVEKVVVQTDIHSAGVEAGIDLCVLKVLTVHERFCGLEDKLAGFDAV